MDRQRWTETQVEQFMGNLLRVGVLVAAATVLIGGVWYLAAHAGDSADYHVFRGEPEALRSPWGVILDVLAGDSRGVIQLGLLLLIATPVLRVAFSVAAFAALRDRVYVLLTLVVLAVLLYSLFGTMG